MAELTWTRRLPVRYEADVAVLGGGMAGIGAALAAARSGAKVILVEAFGVTGGNATVGGVANFCGETKGQGEAFDAVIEALEAWTAIVPYKPYPEKEGRVFDHEILAVLLTELLLQRGIKLLLHTRFADAVTDDRGRITGVMVVGSSGPEGLVAKQYVDCTGEAVVAREAGFETVAGRDSDGLPLPMSMMYFVRERPGEVDPQVPEGWFEPLRDKEHLPMTSIWPGGPGGKAIKIKVPRFHSSDTEQMTAAEIEARRRMMRILDYHQRVEGKPWLLDHCSPRIGIREGRRATGDYQLTVEDLRAGRAFDDAIARGVFYLDAMTPDEDGRTYQVMHGSMHVPPYHIPFRSLHPVGAPNLLVAGRCLSCDQLALSSARVMTTCAMMGQAAGIAAAMVGEGDVGQLDGSDVRAEVVLRGANLAL